MGVYKTLTPSDITRVPFDANKLYTFNSASATNLNINFQQFEFTTSSLNAYSSASTDTSSSIKYHQLDHLFYKNHQLDISNKLGDADYLNQFKTLHRRANIITIPSGLFGNKIKPGTFQMTGSGWNIVDDKKGNLLISGTQLISHSIDEREKVFSLGPTKAFKKYNLLTDFYGKKDPNRDIYYNKNNVLDDSYYTNNLDYKNIVFSEEQAGPNLIRDGHAPTADNWIKNAAPEMAFSNNKIVFTDAAQYQLAYQTNLSFKREATYRVTYTVSGLTEGSVSSLIGAKDGYYIYGTIRSTNGTFTELLTIKNSKSQSLLAINAFWIQTRTAGSDTNTFQISDISVQQVIDAPVANFLTFDAGAGGIAPTSSIVAPHNELYNFNPEDNFAISMYIKPKFKYGYVVSKSTTKSIIKEPIYQQLYTTGSSQAINTSEKDIYPFEVFLNEENNAQGTFQLINFRRSDGIDTSHVSCSIRQNLLSHVVCMKSGSEISIYIEGDKKVSTTDLTFKQTENQANLYIGTKGEIIDYNTDKVPFSGSLSNLMIFNQHKTDEQIKSLLYNVSGTPYIGNMFYSNGLATITSPNYQYIAEPTASTNSLQLKFKSVNTIYENEYMCTVKTEEYNFTHNISTRKVKSDQHTHLANFATGSIWKPYVTTIGLYNEEGELLIVGKLGQPVRMSDETDTTFVIRYDN